MLLLSSCHDNDIVKQLVPDEPNTEEPDGDYTPRLLWASINGRDDAVAKNYRKYNNRILVSWRMLPSDNENTAFDLYRKAGNGEESKLNEKPIVDVTCFQDSLADLSKDNTYRLCYSGHSETVGTYTISSVQTSQGLPYLSIPLKNTTALGADYDPNDASIGDLDGDGMPEIVLKRLIRSGTENIDQLHNTTLLEAYKLNGAFLWRVQLGPNVPSGNMTSFPVYDFDGDGRCEVVVRTSEGTIFNDGTEIGDMDGDGKTDYRTPDNIHTHGMPEFISVIEGASGRELARANYISVGTSEEWGDNYYKRCGSQRMAVAHFSKNSPSILVCRGVYGKSVLEAWNYNGGKLTKLWRFDTSDPAYGKEWEGQGNHSLSVGDVDDDGCDEIVYGGMCVDHDGKGLWNSGHGHGDALHLGKFDPSRDGLQIWSCFEACRFNVGAAFRDARTGQTIWDYPYHGDMGRCLIADVDPDSPGCEMWWYKGNVHSTKGEDLGYSGKSFNMAIWFSGSLNRQLLDKSTIDAPKAGRIFTIYRYDVITINSSKANPCFYGDFLGDWREEVIQPTKDNTELRIFSTWYPTEYKIPYLMSDHVYEMSALNQNIGYNQPTQTGYYLGSDSAKESK